MLTRSAAGVCVGLLATACGSNAAESNDLLVSGPISCRESNTPGSSQLAFCDEQWGLTNAAARTQKTTCDAETDDAGTTGLFQADDGPCPLEGAIGGCVEARAAAVVVIKWWYGDASGGSAPIDCHGNPMVSPAQ
jgi:hypothetical protein